MVTQTSSYINFVSNLFICVFVVFKLPTVLSIVLREGLIVYLCFYVYFKKPLSHTYMLSNNPATNLRKISFGF